MSKKRVLSCIQPTGEIHLGNYFGAVKNWVNLQDEYSCVYGVVDLHAMTMPYDPKVLKENTFQMIVELLACGIDPDKSVLLPASPKIYLLATLYCVLPFWNSRLHAI